jgi:hypothetical protein
MNHAMAAQVPIAASDCGSVADIVDDGEQGSVVPVRGYADVGRSPPPLGGRCLAWGEARQEWTSSAEREFAIDERRARLSNEIYRRNLRTTPY